MENRGHRSSSGIPKYMDDSHMDNFFENPFSVTRAADFTDEQIFQYWVDLSDGHGFQKLIKPRLEMPMLILGGKGSGKTHIMRYLSFPLQKMRHSGDLTAYVRDTGFIGIYMRCSGLNSTRFRGKGQSEDTWADVFSYYMELWLAQMTVDICCEVVSDSSNINNSESSVIADLKDLFDEPATEFPSSLLDLSHHLRDLQRELDVAVNNCAITGVLNITIRASSGKLIFGIPNILSTHFSQLKDILFVYLVDEFENLTESQQKLINTLIREKQNPCSFKIGARLYGVRTYSTFCADENNKEGSEYEQLLLDKTLRENEKYDAFARRLVIRRLANRGILGNPPETDEDARKFLTKAFEQIPTDNLAEASTRFVLEKYSNRERPYFKKLQDVMLQGLKAKRTPGITSLSDINTVVDRLSCPNFPLLEKLNCFILYQKWSSRCNLLESAENIYIDCHNYLREKNTETKYYDKLLHWKYDLLAQLRRECRRKQQYAGFDTLIELSWGNPRHLLILLKNVMAWAAFRDEHPFGEKPISVLAQAEGARETAEWFFRDARIKEGKDGNLVQDAINRLGTLFRSIRYSHKPSECSLSTFSYEQASVSADTQHLIDLAEKWSLLINVGGQRDRNSERVDMKFQMNRILAPRWDVSFIRRGTLAISGDELNAIFDPAFTGQFDLILKTRIDRMTAPFFGTISETKYDVKKNQGTLFGVEDD